MIILRKCYPHLLHSKLHPRTCTALFDSPHSSRDQKVNFLNASCQSFIWLCSSSAAAWISSAMHAAFSDCQFCSQRAGREAVTLQWSIASLFHCDSSSKHSLKYFLLFGFPESLTAYISVNNKHYFPRGQQKKKNLSEAGLLTYPMVFLLRSLVSG